MKFGDTLYQRSVPKWAPYNFKYNELKHLIKTQTSAGAAVPRGIPAQGKSRWEDLDTQLLRLLEAEYDNVTLFLGSKQGEIQRRLAHLEKQIKIAQRAVEDNALDKPILQARKYQQLARDIDGIGDEIQNLSRFAAVQKTAFRKILKKYRKWTGSTALQTRLDVEVFSSKKLQTDFSDYLQQLSEDKAILTDELAVPMLTGRPREHSSDRQQRRLSAHAKRSAIAQIDDAIARGPLDFDAALSTVPYGEAAGSAFYWIHPDNLDEARAFLLRHMRDAAAPPSPSRKSSQDLVGSIRRSSTMSNSSPDLTHLVVFDNAQRFVKDTSVSRPSRIALSGHWSNESKAVITLAGLSPTSSGGTSLPLDRNDLLAALSRDMPISNPSTEVAAAHRYLTEHRDIKPLAEICTHRTRYIGMTNSADVGNWATLDTSVTVTPVDMDQIGEPQHLSQAGDAFPYAILHVRWEFARIPSVVRALDESHLVERVHDFTLEDMAIHTAQQDLPEPSWRSVLQKDIRKVPLVPRISRLGRAARERLNPLEVAGSSSGPSSSDGPTGSVFSVATVEQSSATSEGRADTGEPSRKTTKPSLPRTRRKKRARIQVPPREPPPVRYWNEFDDGDSDVNQEESYVIYVDPNEPMFPGSETVSKAFEVMYDSLSKGTTRVISWLPLSSAVSAQRGSEQTPLLGSEIDPDSSGSETDELIVPQPLRSSQVGRMPRHPKRPMSSTYRPHQILSPRQKALERTLFLFYSGLMALSYVLLVMAGILLGTGRRKARVEVDAGVVAGVISAETCAVAAMILILMRKQRLSVIHWGVVGVLVASAVVLGMALLALMFAGVSHGADRKGPVK